MISESLLINCNDCDAWYTELEVSWTYMDRQVFHDDCRCGSENLRHAHEAGIQTPWQAMRAEIMVLEIEALKKRLERLKRILAEDLGGDL